MKQFDRYLALGDSISIDYFPGLHAVGVTSGKDRSHRPGLGASSLFFRNDDQMHPEFRGRDLSTLMPSLRFINAHDGVFPKADPTDNLTADAATTDDVLYLVEVLKPSEERLLVTVTAGGNDLLAAAQLRGTNSDRNPARETAQRLERICRSLLQKYPNAHVIVATVYDPTDGTFLLPFGNDVVDLGAVASWLGEYNAAVRELVESDARLHLADLHEHFRGHGVGASDFWYWPPSVIEPGIRGASEVRRVWMECVEGIINSEEEER